MSRCYKMQLYVQKVTPAQFDIIVAAFEDNWEVNDSWRNDSPGYGEDDMWVNGTDNLCAGSTEEDFADGLAERVWTELGDFIPLEISCGYNGDMEHPTVFNYNHENYKRLMCQTKPVED